MSSTRTILPSASAPSARSALYAYYGIGTASTNLFSCFSSGFMKYSLSPWLDLATKARVGMTGHYFFHLPQHDEFQKAAQKFPSLKQYFLDCVAKGKLWFAEQVLNVYPELVFEEGHVTASSGQKMYGSALGLAIMTEDFGREGCDLRLLPSDDRIGDTTQTTLLLYSDDDPVSAFFYRVNGLEYTIRQGYNEDELTPEHFQTLKAMYSAEPSLQNQPLNLSHDALNNMQSKAYSAVLKITTKREHTLFVKEEGMYEMLERHIRKCLPIDGEQIIAEEWGKRLKEGWEERKAKKLEEELTALRTISKLIDEAIYESPRWEADLEKPIQTFINAIAPKGIIEEGFQWNKELLDTAFEIGRNVSYRIYGKYYLFFNRIIASIQVIATDNSGMAQAQGLHGILTEGRKFKRSLEFSSTQQENGSYFSRSNNFWVDAGMGGPLWIPLDSARSLFKSLCKQKQQFCDNLSRRPTITRNFSNGS